MKSFKPHVERNEFTFGKVSMPRMERSKSLTSSEEERIYFQKVSSLEWRGANHQPRMKRNGFIFEKVSSLAWRGADCQPQVERTKFIVKSFSASNGEEQITFLKKKLRFNHYEQNVCLYLCLTSDTQK